MTVIKPWGSYKVIMSEGLYKVKILSIAPVEKLSTQLHYHRFEHWVIVKGTAKIRINDDVGTYSENQSVFIPIGTVHSIENIGCIELTIVEVQYGCYLEEDDIVRIEDKYGRT